MDFLVFSDDWSGHPSSAIHLFRRLLASDRVFWFNTIYRMPGLTRYDIARTLRKLRDSAAAPTREPGPAPLEVTPWTLPIFRGPVRGVNRFLFRRLYRDLAREHDIRQPVAVATNPFSVDAIRVISPQHTVYYCVDDYTEFPGVNGRAAAALERELLERTDLLAATSRPLLESRRVPGASHYLPHGVDFDHFHAAPAPAPAKRPVIGFFGLISEWIDLDVVLHAARERPGWRFELIGRAEVDTGELVRLGNVTLRGPVDYAELPRAARAFDVGLVPFKTNALTRAVNPLKLLEYLALGIPVVATPLPELERFRPHVSIAADPQAFLAALDAAVAGDCGSSREDRIELARENSWDARARELRGWIAELAG
ncbi:MAG: glycosyltransferase family 1 protein [bacterium]|nr:glycosyltransferase family 1 protein [bacterium]